MSLTIRGHQRQRRILYTLLSRKELPPTMLFSGAPGIGKSLVARELAKTLLCEMCVDRLSIDDQISFEDLGPGGGCDTCSLCRVFEAGNAPDFYWVNCKDKEKWNTAAIRSLLSSLHLRSFSGTNRVVVLNDVEYMNAQSANALLKILEEPRPQLYFVLVTSNRSKLLPTLLSRCHTWSFGSLSAEDVRSVLEEVLEGDFPPHLLEFISELADGSIEQARRYASQLDLIETFQARLDRLLSGDMRMALDFANELSSARDELRDHLELLQGLVRHLLLKEKERATQAQLARLLENLLRADYWLFDRHANAYAFLADLFTSCCHSRTTATFVNLDTPYFEENL